MVRPLRIRIRIPPSPGAAAERAATFDLAAARLVARVTAAGLIVGAASGCSPTFNWREVPIGDQGLVALLPCKADRAQRDLPLGVDAVAVGMAGCEAGGATFAVAHAAAADAVQAEAWMRAWRGATRTQLGEAPVTETPATLPRAATSPSPVRLDSPGAPSSDAVQRSVATHILWFAQQRDGKVSLYQATVLGEPSSADAVTVFFEGLRIP